MKGRRGHAALCVAGRRGASHTQLACRRVAAFASRPRCSAPPPEACRRRWLRCAVVQRRCTLRRRRRRRCRSCRCTRVLPHAKRRMPRARRALVMADSIQRIRPCVHHLAPRSVLRSSSVVALLLLLTRWLPARSCVSGKHRRQDARPGSLERMRLAGTHPGAELWLQEARLRAPGGRERRSRRDAVPLQRVHQLAHAALRGWVDTTRTRMSIPTERTHTTKHGN